MGSEARPILKDGKAEGTCSAGSLEELYRSSFQWLPGYLRQSYRMSACDRLPTRAEISAHRGLLMCERLQATNVSILADYIETGAVLRAPPRSGAGPEEDGCEGVEAALADLLHLANERLASADELAELFKLLSPYTSANGRCSRALWMWRMAHGSAKERAMLHSHSAAELWGRKKAWAARA